MRALHGFGLECQIGHVAEAPVKGDAFLVGPGQFHQIQSLGEVCDEGPLVHAERREIPGPAARGDADVQAPMAQAIDGGDGCGQLQRVML
ncbi:Uncharacterised protein [Mycobacteroides abscessus subsp. abscessus]|nr:Uncharacterised protein [Mycobacteroides abscessus subsp. abscessus]